MPPRSRRRGTRRRRSTRLERRTNLLVDARRFEERRAAAIAMDSFDHVRKGLLQVADDPAMSALVVDLRTHEVAGEEIADDPKGLCLLVDERRRRGGLRLRLDRLPEALQEDEVALDVLGRAPSAAVRTMIPPPFGSRSSRSRPGACALHPRADGRHPSPHHSGRTRGKRPGKGDLGRQPRAFDFIGSLTACTRMVWPPRSRSWIFRAPFRPSSSGPTISST